MELKVLTYGRLAGGRNSVQFLAAVILNGFYHDVSQQSANVYYTVEQCVLRRGIGLTDIKGPIGCMVHIIVGSNVGIIVSVGIGGAMI